MPSLRRVKTGAIALSRPPAGLRSQRIPPRTLSRPVSRAPRRTDLSARRCHARVLHGSCNPHGAARASLLFLLTTTRDRARRSDSRFVADEPADPTVARIVCRPGSTGWGRLLPYALNGTRHSFVWQPCTVSLGPRVGLRDPWPLARSPDRQPSPSAGDTSGPFRLLYAVTFAVVAILYLARPLDGGDEAAASDDGAVAPLRLTWARPSPHPLPPGEGFEEARAERAHRSSRWRSTRSARSRRPASAARAGSPGRTARRETAGRAAPRESRFPRRSPWCASCGRSS